VQKFVLSLADREINIVSSLLAGEEPLLRQQLGKRQQEGKFTSQESQIFPYLAFHNTRTDLTSKRVCFSVTVCGCTCVCVCGKQLIGAVGAITGGVGALLFALEQSVQASGGEVHAHAQGWNHKGLFDALDHQR